MAIERAHAHAVPKPWGVADLRPWYSAAAEESKPIGEVWFERPAVVAPEPALLLKLLYTSQPLSIQVHPGDAYAQSIGLARGKTEAWYVLDASSNAEVAIGLKKPLAARKLRDAVINGSIEDLVAWRSVRTGDAIAVPSGTIHAIGAGLVIAEIQQRSDATFRMFDFGRDRELHVSDAVAVALGEPENRDQTRIQMTSDRTVLVSNLYFAFERITLAPGRSAHTETESETWILLIAGSGRTGPFDVKTGDAVFAQSETVHFTAGPNGMTYLTASAQERAGDVRSPLLRHPPDWVPRDLSTASPSKREEPLQ